MDVINSAVLAMSYEWDTLMKDLSTDARPKSHTKHYKSSSRSQI